MGKKTTIGPQFIEENTGDEQKLGPHWTQKWAKVGKKTTIGPQFIEENTEDEQKLGPHWAQKWAKRPQ